VRTLLLAGLAPFHARLNALGLSLTEPPEHYGYGLALGAAEVRLVDLANAYRTLANGGRWSSWRLQPGPAGPWRAVIDPAAAYLVTDILADRSARAPAFGLDNALATPGWVAAKTGTSKDMRDNWAVGFTRHYTVAVWVGNADGEPMWDVSGVTGAAPAWRAIVGLLGESDEPPTAPAGVESRSIRFDPAVEPPRQEWFLAGTGQDRIELAGDTTGPRIVYPVSGLILAIDPDIPQRAQRLWWRAQHAEGLHWQLDGHPAAVDAAPQAWAPVPGKHVLTLADAAGREKATVQFEVRGHAGR
jgi:penicillin-binding protein 1C